MGLEDYKLATITITPIQDLKFTASILGEVLSINFVEDKNGTFDEFPAYIGVKEGLRYALLGIPDPEWDLRENPTNIFQLEVDPADACINGMRVDISPDIKRVIDEDGRIESFIELMDLSALNAGFK